MLEWGIPSGRDPKYIFLEGLEFDGDQIVSSLQAFEVSILMLGLGRFPNAMISISNAIELVCRHSISTQRDYLKLIDNFCDKHNISENLRSAAHETRKIRNTFVHMEIFMQKNKNPIFLELAIRPPGAHIPELYKCRALESELKRYYSQPTITLRDFLMYDLSDENCEGCNITQKAIDNYNDSQLQMFIKRFNGYGVLNSRYCTLNSGDKDEDLTMDKIRLVKNIEEILDN